MDPVRWRQFEARMRLMFYDMKGEITTRNWNEPMKPWSEFFQRFTAPEKDIQTTMNRVILNSHIYQTNYCFIVGAIFLVYCLYHPSSVLVIGAILVGFVYTTSPTPIVIQGKRITRRDRYRVFFLLSFIALLATGVLLSFLKTLSFALVIVLSHACFRHTNVRQKMQFRNQPSDSW